MGAKSSNTKINKHYRNTLLAVLALVATALALLGLSGFIGFELVIGAGLQVLTALVMLLSDWHIGGANVTTPTEAVSGAGVVAGTVHYLVVNHYYGGAPGETPPAPPSGDGGTQ